MHTHCVSPSALPFPPAQSAPFGAKLASFLVLTSALAGMAPLAHADEGRTLLGAGIGAVTGAAIGQSVGGRNGAILGAGAGGLVGASIANQEYSQQGHRQHGPLSPANPPATYYRPPVVHYQPPVAAWQPPRAQIRYGYPNTYYQPPRVWQAPVQNRYYRRDERHRHRHHHDYRNDHHYDGRYNDRY